MLPPLLVLGPVRLGLPDICSLGGLITPTEQEKRRWTTLSIIHAVARAVVNLEFPYTTAHCVRITEIAETHARRRARIRARARASRNPSTHSSNGTLFVGVTYISMICSCASPIAGL